MATQYLIQDTDELPDIEKAQLPVAYNNAKKALAACERVDECARWTNKIKAVVSYARQSKDETLLNTALRIQARAIERTGQLLNEIMPERGPEAKGKVSPQAKVSPPTKHRKGQGIKAAAPRPLSPLSRSQVARIAGLSADQQTRAIQVANIPKKEFERLVERKKPPTATELAEIGRRRQTVSIDHLEGRDPKDFRVVVARGLLDAERRRILIDISKARGWLNDLETEVRKAQS